MRYKEGSSLFPQKAHLFTELQVLKIAVSHWTSIFQHIVFSSTSWRQTVQRNFKFSHNSIWGTTVFGSLLFPHVFFPPGLCILMVLRSALYRWIQIHISSRALFLISNILYPILLCNLLLECLQHKFQMFKSGLLFPLPQYVPVLLCLISVDGHPNYTRSSTWWPDLQIWHISLIDALSTLICIKIWVWILLKMLIMI